MSVNSNICPNCEEMNGPVEFKTDLGEGDVMVCEDCYNDLEGWQEDTDDEDDADADTAENDAVKVNELAAAHDAISAYWAEVASGKYDDIDVNAPWEED